MCGSQEQMTTQNYPGNNKTSFWGHLPKTWSRKRSIKSYRQVK